MVSKPIRFTILVTLIVVFLTIQVVLSDDTVPIPADKAQLSSWFTTNVGPLEQRKNTLDPALVTAEASAKVVKVMQDGSGDFKTITDAINSVPSENANRVIIYIGAGNYNEKIKIEKTKPFVTLYGVPENMPNLTFGGTADKFGTVDSATLIVESDYFVAVNMIISNSAPIPDESQGDQAVALRISGDKATFYNCTMLGFQDTVCDDRHRHFFKDCLIQGTIDYIFGSGKSLYLNTELRTFGDDKKITFITAQARKNDTEDDGYSFVHCDVTGTGSGTFLGRAWMSHPKVIFAYCNITSVVKKEGWTNNLHPEFDKTARFGEYQNKGPGADPAGRASICKQLTDEEVKPYITLAMIEGSKWLLPPPIPKI